MAYEIKEKSGALFKNDNKERDAQPDFTGNFKLGGKVWRLSAWNSESRAGTDYLSIRISDPEDFKRRDDAQSGSQPRRLSDEEFEEERKRRLQQAKPAPRTDFGADYSDEDIPF